MTPSEPHRMAGNPPRPADWTGFFASDLVAANDFMAEHERLPLQERALGLQCLPHDPSPLDSAHTRLT